MNKKRERVECADCGIVAIVCACADGIEIDVITIVRFYVKHRIGCACDVHSIHSLEMEILRSIVLRRSRIYLVRSSARTCLLIQLPRRNCKLMLICVPKKKKIVVFISLATPVHICENTNECVALKLAQRRIYCVADFLNGEHAIDSRSSRCEWKQRMVRYLLLWLSTPSGGPGHWFALSATI